eukprot:361809-Chlamydomonas_euryale.AAC.4
MHGACGRRRHSCLWCRLHDGCELETGAHRGQCGSVELAATQADRDEHVLTDAAFAYPRAAVSATGAPSDRAVYSGGAYDTAVYSGAAYDRAVYSGGAYDRAVYSGAAYDTAVYSGAAYDTVVYSGAAYNRTVYGGAAYNRAVYGGGDPDLGPESAQQGANPGRACQCSAQAIRRTTCEVSARCWA